MSNHTISGTTKYIALIGNPIKNSLSPKIHNASFDRMGLDYRYLAHSINDKLLVDVMRGMREMGYVGFNVTSPCKSAIMPYLDEVSEVAQIIGAVNTVVIHRGRFMGDNADGPGFMRNLVFNGVNIRGKKITVLGGGGACSAVITQAALDGVAQIDVFNRNDEFVYKINQVIERVREAAPNCVITLNYLEDEEKLTASLADSELVVNTTTVGTPEVPGCLLKKEMLRPELIVADVVYEPRETELIKLAKECGCRTVDGVGMFLQQAAMAERLWLGCSMPVSEIEEEFF